MSFIKLQDRKKRLFNGLDLKNDCCERLCINKLQKHAWESNLLEVPTQKNFQTQNKETDICKKQSNKKSSTDIADFGAQKIVVLLFFSYFLRV